MCGATGGRLSECRARRTPQSFFLSTGVMKKAPGYVKSTTNLHKRIHGTSPREPLKASRHSMYPYYIDGAMQSYNKDSIEKGIGKKILSSFLGFLKYKVDNDQLTLEEEQAMLRIIERDLPLFGTSEDFARYFRKTPGNVRAVINRKVLAKPKRRVLYSFLDFIRSVPEKWISGIGDG